MDTNEATAPRCSVIIVHYNTPALLIDCLTSLAALPEAGTLEVLVVDNGSADAAGAEAQARAIWPALVWLGNATNRGFAAANNQGLERARGPYLCLLNSDTVVRPGALAALLAYLEARPRVAVAGPRLLNPDGSLQPSCFRLPTLARTLGDGLLITNALRRLPAVDAYAGWPHDRERLVEAVSGACLVVRREAVAQVGGLDERFWMYAEESDWCRRFRAAGWAVGFCPTAVIIHRGQGSWAGDTGAALDAAERGRRAYFAKHYGPLGVALWHGTALLGSGLRALTLARRPAAARHRRRLAWHWRALRHEQ